MAQALSDIMKELDAGYNPSRQLINQQLAALPAESKAQLTGLDATKDQAFGQITDEARDRGIGFSGIPLDEQAKYTASTYLPAVANLKATQNQNKTTLLGALNDLGTDQLKTALGIQTQQKANDIAEQQAEAQQRAADESNAALAALYNPPASQTPAAPSLPKGMAYKKGSTGNQGFDFSWGSKPVSAATFAKVNNLNIGDLLYSMAQSGDAYAASAYRSIVNNKGNITPAIMNKYSSLFWGEIPAATTAPAKKTTAPSSTQTILRYNSPVSLFSKPLGSY